MRANATKVPVNIKDRISLVVHRMTIMLSNVRNVYAFHLERMSLVTSVHVEGTSENRRREAQRSQRYPSETSKSYSVLLSSWTLRTQWI